MILTRRSFLSAAAAGVSSPIWAKAITARVSDSQLLTDIEHRTFNFYWERTNHSNGLMADRWSTPSSCSTTGTGFALTAWPIGVERGWITRKQARDITLRTLRFFEQLPQGDQRSGTAGYRGFYYHFIDMETGLRLRNWDWELSTIDTAWLQMGMVFAQGWFDQQDEKEKEIRALVQRLLDRTEWDWMQANSRGGKGISMGWSPESGFIERNWDGYNEAMALYFLALGSPSHPAEDGAYEAWTAPFPKYWRGEGANRHPSDVWSSPDGLTWQQATPAGGWSQRISATATVFNNQLWYTAGDDPLNFVNYNDVWSSPDGQHWTQHTVLAPFVGLYSHVALAANGRAWVIGGFDGDARQDVWSTADGVNWIEATAAPGFTPRYYMPGISFNNKLWIFGGQQSGTLPPATDIWSSADGQTWSLVNANAAYGANFNNKVVALGTNLWLIGGDVLREVWTSSDGANWTQVNPGASFPVRSWFQVLSYSNRLWVIGGFNGDLYNDVWSSSDGITWTMATAAAAFSPRSEHAAVVFNGKMWVIGGYDTNSMKNDVWWSTDGVTWTQATAAAAFTPRTLTQALVLNNQLCIVAGYDGSRIHDMWCSPDGVQWRLAVSATMSY